MKHLVEEFRYLLLEYESYIQKANNAFAIRYNLNKSPLSAVRKKEIDRIGFITIDQQEVSYVFHFVCSYPTSSIEMKDQETYNEVIILAEKEGLIRKGTVYKIEILNKEFVDWENITIPERNNNS